MFKTSKSVLSTDDIEGFITKHEAENVPKLKKMWRYYVGDNPGIKDRQQAKEGNPDNKTAVPYGRKIITTFQGYAYRPRYITYNQGSADEAGYNQLMDTFNVNNEWIKTSRNGRNTGIYGVAHEMMYVDGIVGKDLSVKAEPRFFCVDPKEIILIYDYSAEPKKVVGIRYYPLDATTYKVEVYYVDRVEVYERKVDDSGKWVYSPPTETINFFDAIPIIEYAMGDEKEGLIAPVHSLIDDYDIIVSDSIIEFSRFANAYLRIVGAGIVGPTDNRKENISILKRIKEMRIFNNLKEADDVTFLTKDIPKEFIEFMTSELKKQIHVQSHVPDFNEMATGSLSGAAVQRLLFDFENVCSAAEADFDVGLNERISLINTIYAKARKPVAEGIVISHKRNIPLNMQDFAQTALTLKQAGFSRRLIASVLPDDILTDVEDELAEQDKDAESSFPDVDNVPDMSEESAE